MINFWDKSLWLPENVTWDDLKSTEHVRYPDIWELSYSLKYGAIMILIRIIIESFVFLPIGYICGWINAPDGVLPRICEHLCYGFAGTSKFKRVAETAWRFVFYVVIWISGFFVLWDKPWLRNTSECWRRWPHHPISESVWWYYMIETAFYWSLLFSSIVFDIRRSDFWQMTLHHSITLVLLFMSFAMNMVRVGTLILFSHDVADIIIELGKLFRYAGWDNALMVVFGIFLFVWTATRLIYYPFWIIKSVIFDAPPLIQESYRWENLSQPPVVPRILVGMLLCLLFLHFFWTYVIVKIAITTVQEGNVADIREEGQHPLAEASTEEQNKHESKKEL
ncbi:hypothetical protein AB6A40_002950 [Gnathostoma spinigerum]|uniref:TLC domain-containing protein n=1 Tax=Gnathostoma spinigerum TaxID=75299 RepID=A0ABD6EFQ3_9BILA